MPKFYFDVFDGSAAVVDQFGDDFICISDAAGQAEELLVDFAREAIPEDEGRDFGVVVRDDGGRNVYRAVLIFRDSHSNPPPPGTPRDAPSTLTVPDPTDLIRLSQETRRQSAEIRQRLREALNRSQEAIERLSDALRCRLGEVAVPEGPSGVSRGAPQRAA